MIKRPNNGHSWVSSLEIYKMCMHKVGQVSDPLICNWIDTRVNTQASGSM